MGYFKLLCRQLTWVHVNWQSFKVFARLRLKECDVLFCAAPEEDVLKGKQSIRSSVLGKQNSESELLLEDDDTLSSLEEKELENLTGKEQPHKP